MRISEFLLPTLKENPSEAQVTSHRLMLRSGMIRQTSVGIYSWLPLGLKVLRKVEEVIREEMNKAGALEILMPTIQPSELWRESGRYDAYGKEMLRMQDRHGRDMLYGPTHEEVVTDIFRRNVKSYREMPKNLYQIQWKFRDEIRPRFGVMRGREFLMKDAYSFDLDYAGALNSYNKMYLAYFKIFSRLGLSAIPVRADSGAIGGDLSHEFTVLADTGENLIYYDESFDAYRANPENFDIEAMKGIYAVSDEKHDPANCPVAPEKLKSARGIEVGHVFYLGTKYSKAMDVKVTTQDGKEIFPEMGCYGIGVSRLVAAIIEAHHDSNGIIWPEAVAPFKAGIINLKPSDSNCTHLCEAAYKKLSSSGWDVLYDDADASIGQKFSNMDLIGLPWQMIIGSKGAEKGLIELKNRHTGEKLELDLESACAKISA